MIWYFIYIFELNLRLVGTEDVLGLGIASQVFGLGGWVLLLRLGLLTSGLDSKSVKRLREPVLYKNRKI